MSENTYSISSLWHDLIVCRVCAGFTQGLTSNQGLGLPPFHWLIVVGSKEEAVKYFQKWSNFLITFFRSWEFFDDFWCPTTLPGDNFSKQLWWLTLKFNQSKNTTRIKIMTISMRKSLILTNKFEKFSPSGGPPSGRLLKRRAVSDGPLRGG